MVDEITLMVFGHPARQTRKPAPYRDPMADVTRATVGGVQAMIAVTIGTTVLRAIKG